MLRFWLNIVGILAMILVTSVFSHAGELGDVNMSDTVIAQVEDTHTHSGNASQNTENMIHCGSYCVVSISVQFPIVRHKKERFELARVISATQNHLPFDPPPPRA